MSSCINMSVLVCFVYVFVYVLRTFCCLLLPRLVLMLYRYVMKVIYFDIINPTTYTFISMRASMLAQQTFKW